MSTTEHHRIVIVGTGFAGLGAAIRLRQRGVEDFVILERANDLGGTWRDNSYPGCACDVPSHLYSFSFAQNPNWSRSFSPQPEIWDYLRSVAEEYDVVRHIRYDHELLEASWDESSQRWEIETSQGPFSAGILISGMGGLSEPRTPSLPGVETFAGTSFHSATWDHDHDLRGERVAVIGTGASAIQFVPQIQPEVAELQLYQRTAPWVLPKADKPIPKAMQRFFRLVPPAQRAFRALIYWLLELQVLGFTRERRIMKVLAGQGRRHLEKAISDPALRAKLTPSFTPGCKRILYSNNYYPALAHDNVDVITSGVREIREHSIVTTDGTERPVDTIIWGTGFAITDQPIMHRVRGRDGRLLADHWGGTMRAHQGTTVTGFPNLFLLLGPNTGLGHTSVVFMIECQIQYVMDALRVMDERGAATLEVTPQAQARFIADVDARMQGTVWTAGGCDSWYLDSTGRNSTLWPDFTFKFRSQTEKLDPDEYTFEAPVAAPAPVVA